MEKKNKEDLLHHSIIFKILSSLLYLIAYPILFIVTKLWLGLKIEGRENLSKVGDEYITVANHINMIDCAIVPILFTYREVDDIRRFIRKKPFITLTILEPEYPLNEISKISVKELKDRVYNKMNRERMKKVYNEEIENNIRMQEYM